MLSEIPASGMNNEILSAFIIDIKFNEVISSSKRADASFNPINVMKLVSTAQSIKDSGRHGWLVMNVESCRNTLTNKPIKFIEINVSHSEIYG